MQTNISLWNLQFLYTFLLYSFAESYILIGWLAVRKKPYPDRCPHFSVFGSVSRMLLSYRGKNWIKFALFGDSQSILLNLNFRWRAKIKWMTWAHFRVSSAVETYVRYKNAFFRNERLISHKINSLLTSLVRSLRWNIVLWLFIATSLDSPGARLKPQCDILVLASRTEIDVQTLQTFWEAYIFQTLQDFATTLGDNKFYYSNF